MLGVRREGRGVVIFARETDGRVKLDATVLEEIRRFRQTCWWHREAGGVLLGRRIELSTDVVIDQITPPLAGDRRTRTSFHRSAELHQRAIDAAWERSGGTCLYLGEWHTHPETDPTPSGIDLSDWRRRLRDDVFEGSELFFVIVGTRTIGLWEGRRQGGPFATLVRAGVAGAPRESRRTRR